MLWLWPEMFFADILLKTKYPPTTDILRDYQLSKSTKILHISNGYLKSTTSTPGVSNNPKL